MRNNKNFDVDKFTNKVLAAPDTEALLNVRDWGRGDDMPSNCLEHRPVFRGSVGGLGVAPQLLMPGPDPTRDRAPAAWPGRVLW